MNSQIDVLAVDDDDITAEMVERAMQKTPGNFRVIPACDGQEALDILRGQSPKIIRRPYIILLDLNMPRMNGFEFLEAVRADRSLKDSVIFIMTTSSSDHDLNRAYSEQVAGYMIKSAIGPQFVRLAVLLHDYARTVSFPA
ncbi:MAG: response regulator [Sphingobium sp.]